VAILLLLLTFHFSLFTVNAQTMEVKDFTRMKRPLWKRSKVVVEKQKALLDLTTTEKGFTFKVNGTEEAEVAEDDGIITVKVPHKTRFLTIAHPTFGQLTWRAPVKYLKRKKHYRATLLTSDPTKAYKLSQQWVVMQVQPANAIVHMDSTVHLLRDGNLALQLPFGTHNYQVESPFYEEVTDSFCLSDTAKTVLNITLQPAYSYLKVVTPWTGADIYVDGQLLDPLSSTSSRLMAGTHYLSVRKGGLSYYESSIQIGRAEKRVITLTQSDFDPRWMPKVTVVQPQATADTVQTAQAVIEPVASVTLKAATDDTEILVDRVLVGRGEWSGQLTKGYHQLNTRQDSVESATSDLWIDSELPLEQQLAVPQTSEAFINIHSNVVGAQIFINNRLVGQTPYIVEHLPANKMYEVRLEKKGYKTVCQKVQPKGNELTDMNIKMKKK
jgi:hypothetical protein